LKGALILLMVFCRSLISAGDWPLFKRDVTRTGHAREQAYPSLTQAWMFDGIQGEVRSSPVVAGGKIFIGGRDGSVWALDAETGAIMWQYSTEGYVDATPAASNGVVYAPSIDGRLYAFRADNGETPLWSYTTGSRDMSSPAVYDNRLYWTTGFPGKYLMALDAQTGALAWQRDLGAASLSSPALEAGVVAVGNNDGLVSAFDAASGATQWTRQTGGRMEFASLAGDGAGHFYAVGGGDDPKLYAWNALTGQAKTGFPVDLVDLSAQAFGKPAAEPSSVVVADGNVYVAMTGVTAPDTVELQLFCRSAADGSEIWPPQIIGRVPDDLTYAATPAVVNDVIYAGSGDGFLYMLRAADGGLIGSVDLGNPIVASPAVANGKVYVATLNGKVYAFQAARVAAIAFPADGATVGGTVEIAGEVTNPSLQSYALEYGVGTNPASWTAITTSSNAASGALASWNTSALAPQTYTLRLSVTQSGVNQPQATAYASFAIDASHVRSYIDAATGGSLVSPDSTTLTVGAGALSQSDFVTLQKPSPPAGPTPEGATAVGVHRQVDFDLANTQFLLPATLTIPYTNAEVVGVSTSALKMFYWTGTAWTLLANSTVDTASGTVSSLITQEGTYGLFEYRVVDKDTGFVYISPDGAEVHVPPGAFTQADSITVAKHTSGDFLNVRLPGNLHGLPEAFEFLTGDPATKFAKLVTIKLPYNPAALNGAPESRLRVYLWYPSENVWRIVNNSVVDAAAKKVSVQVSHFSIYRVMAFLSSEALMEKDKVYTYPNPATGDTVTFKTYLGDDATLTIDVFNVAGEKIARLANSGLAGNVVETPWNISGIASGVYIYHVEAKTPSGAKAEVTKKLAIIH